MSFDWSHYLQLAEQLHQQPRLLGDEEASLRCSISRAYYAVFCTARNVAIRRGIQFAPRRSVHQEVIDYYSKRPNQVEQGVARNLRRLRRHRNQADYDDTISQVNHDASFVVLSARRLHTIISGLP